MTVYFDPLNMQTGAENFTFSVSPVAVTLINAKSSFGRVQSKATFANVVRARGTAGRIQSKAIFANVARAGGTFGRVQSKISGYPQTYTENTFWFGPSSASGVATAITFSTSTWINAVGNATFGRVGSVALLSTPVFVNARGTMGRVRSESDITVPFALRHLASLPALQSSARVFVPPLELTGISTAPGLASKALILTPYGLRDGGGFARLTTVSELALTFSAWATSVVPRLTSQASVELVPPGELSGTLHLGPFSMSGSLAVESEIGGTFSFGAFRLEGELEPAESEIEGVLSMGAFSFGGVLEQRESMSGTLVFGGLELRGALSITSSIGGNITFGSLSLDGLLAVPSEGGNNPPASLGGQDFDQLSSVRFGYGGAFTVG